MLLNYESFPFSTFIFQSADVIFMRTLTNKNIQYPHVKIDMWLQPTYVLSFKLCCLHQTI